MKAKGRFKLAQRNGDFRYLAEVQTFIGLSQEEIDIAVNGIPFQGKRYQLNYVFWGRRLWRKVLITLPNVLVRDAIQIGVCKISAYHDIPAHTRSILLVEDRVTDLAPKFVQVI